MKLILSIVCLTVCLAAAAANFCASADDCEEGRCCAAVTSLRLSGYCFKLNIEMSKCNPVEAKQDYYGGKYWMFCPCREGLECGDPGGDDFGRCQVPEPEPELEPEPEAEVEPEEIPQGPGGEPPRDDDCADWEHPC